MKREGLLLILFCLLFNVLIQLLAFKKYEKVKETGYRVGMYITIKDSL